MACFVKKCKRKDKVYYRFYCNTACVFFGPYFHTYYEALVTNILSPPLINQDYLGRPLDARIRDLKVGYKNLKQEKIEWKRENPDFSEEDYIEILKDYIIEHYGESYLDESCVWD
jgi:hypothetical protein